MDWIRARFEHLVIGTILAGVNEPANAAYLQADDFEFPFTGGLYADLLHIGAAQPGWDTTKIAAVGARRHTTAGVTAALLLRLADDARAATPETRAAAYAQVAWYGSASAIENELKVIGVMRSHAQAMAAYARLGLALHRAEHIQPSEDGSRMQERWLEHHYGYNPVGDNEHHAAAEHTVLAGLLRTPQAGWVIANLPEAAFIDPLHRTVYHALTHGELPAPPRRPTSDQVTEVVLRLHVRGEVDTNLDDIVALDGRLTRLYATRVGVVDCVTAAGTLFPDGDGLAGAAR
ncbi:hypothetical protein Cs7R123_32580 [Catellatospora sp. TT07R-123]|uniref:hypothetical protein n=1 Tax=Catellatospora sp. TT07R-123 TaxID=2733863 RepID=UPI001AFE0E90|nr:hypothetical protein [Catellatospora sp. TT07R-123]GHJ45916.1 hypothetical protein Cs7R123_32580 [Catellatospora sp. TT07R-123]